MTLILDLQTNHRQYDQCRLFICSLILIEYNTLSSVLGAEAVRQERKVGQKPTLLQENVKG
jgi:hypothetical protein